MLNWRWSLAIVIGFVGVLLGVMLFPRSEPADGLSVQTGGWKDFLAQFGIGSPSTGADPDDIIVFTLRDKSDPKVQVRLGIPKKYLHSFEASSWSKTYRFTTIEAILPDMRPASIPSGGQPSIRNPTPEQQAEWRNQVTIEWSGGKSAPGYSVRDSYTHLTRDMAVVGDTNFGLQHFRRRVCAGSQPGEHAKAVKADIPGWKCVWMGNDVFTFLPVANQAWLYMRCTEPRGDFGGRCRVWTHIRGWGIEYTFDRRELRRWQEFDGGVRKLMESFFIAGERGVRD